MTNYAIQEQNQDLVSLLAAHFRLLYNPTHAFSDAVGMLQMFPQLRGLWPMSSATNDAVDLSGQGRLLTRNGGVTYGVDGLIPYAAFNGTTDYLSRADESGTDILGTESFVDPSIRGLTMGCWVYFSSVAGVDNIIAKRASAGQLSYYLRNIAASSVLNFEVTPDGSTPTSVSTASAPPDATWVFCACRFDPSAEMAIWLNSEKSVNTTSIPASIFNSTAPFQISGYNGANELLSGRVTLAFLCAAAVPDIFINTFYQMTAPLFGISV